MSIRVLLVCKPKIISDSNIAITMKRAIVGLKTSNGINKVPKFSECLVECFSKGLNSVCVNFSLENETLILSESANGVELRHSPECPIRLLSKSGGFGENSSFPPNIGIATSVVIESSDSHILLTKRAAHMRSSPNVWVFPGGHLEPNETIFEAGIREVKEETGLDIFQDKATVMGLWENVYPLLLGVGPPKYHILIIYLYSRLNETHEELTQKIIPDPEEVESFCWLNSSTITKLFNFNETSKIDGKQYFYENGKIIEKNLDYSSMFNRWLWQQPEPYSGVNYALRKWMDKFNIKTRLCKH